MSRHHTPRGNRIAALLHSMDLPDRDRAVEAAVEEHLARFRRARLAEACARLDPAEEQELAEEGMGSGPRRPER
ncbi:MAG TPA: hypothetical protein VF263_06615 [Longimicrobiaceae bacterium]